MERKEWQIIIKLDNQLEVINPKGEIVFRMLLDCTRSHLPVTT
ncbi:hypothetical protein [Iningainema tapete]|nr:hypothetical protein [Iningainema tapete]